MDKAQGTAVKPYRSQRMMAARDSDILFALVLHRYITQRNECHQEEVPEKAGTAIWRFACNIDGIRPLSSLSWHGFKVVGGMIAKLDDAEAVALERAVAASPRMQQLVAKLEGQIDNRSAGRLAQAFR